MWAIAGQAPSLPTVTCEPPRDSATIDDILLRHKLFYHLAINQLLELELHLQIIATKDDYRF